MPSLSADHPEYDPGGGYWLGGVWPPTNYMVLRGLDRAGYNDLAHEISREDLDNVVRVYKDTGTLWENYAPERAAQGNRAKDDFVGWSGLAPIAGLFEYVFGLARRRPQRPAPVGRTAPRKPRRPRLVVAVFEQTGTLWENYAPSGRPMATAPKTTS